MVAQKVIFCFLNKTQFQSNKVCYKVSLCEEFQRQCCSIAGTVWTAGIWGLGLATRSCNLHKVPLGVDGNSWVLRHDGVLASNGQEIGRIEELPQEGDIIVSSLLICMLVYCLVLDFLHDSVTLLVFSLLVNVLLCSFSFGRGVEYCDQLVCLCVCLCVCHEHISGTNQLIFMIFCVQITCGHGSVLLLRNLCTSSFTDDVMFGRNGREAETWHRLP